MLAKFLEQFRNLIQNNGHYTQVMNSLGSRLWLWPGWGPPSQWCPRGLGHLARPGTRCLSSRNAHCFYPDSDPGLAKHGSYWELWLESCLMTIIMAGTSDWSVTSHTGLWLADVIPMYHWTMWTCTSHYPASLWLRRSITLSCPIRVLNSEHADCIHR